jgi:predicted AlkP superfamily phosphohydrolase/phosphomutase
MKRMFILALDGTPFTFLKSMIEKGHMPRLASLAGQGIFRQMDSVIPPVSSSAWTSFMTGQTPAYHGIWGFLDRQPASLQLYVPDATHIRSKTLWDILSRHGKRCFVMNVPMTAPPQPINGIIIGGFPASNLDQAVYPAEIGKVLKARGYRIDADVELAKTDSDAFLLHLEEALEKRLEIMRHYRQQGSWDFFMAHIMETDRLHHFFWEHMADGHPRYAPAFINFYRRIDELIGEVAGMCDDETALLLLSDHGFTSLKKEVYLNVFLQQQGFFKRTKTGGGNLGDMHPESIAYSIYPGRIYINLRGREKYGSIHPGTEYDRAVRAISIALGSLTDPETGQSIIQRIITRSELIEGTDSSKLLITSTLHAIPDNFLDSLPDLLAMPHAGYDLKGNFDHDQLFDKTVFNGMHTPDDAFILARSLNLPEERFSITRLFSIILNYFAVTASSISG